MKLKQKIGMGVKGFYTIETVSPDGEVKNWTKEWGYEDGKMPNMILDNGIKLILEGVLVDPTSQASVGTSADDDSPSKKGVSGTVKRTYNKSQSQSYNAEKDFFSYVSVCDFSIGDATGTWSEVAVSSVGSSEAKNKAFSRTRLRDSFGDPTTITVLNNEILRVTYELQIHVTVPSTPQTIQWQELDGTPVTTTVTWFSAANGNGYGHAPERQFFYFRMPAYNYRGTSNWQDKTVKSVDNGVARFVYEDARPQSLDNIPDGLMFMYDTSFYTNSPTSPRSKSFEFNPPLSKTAEEALQTEIEVTMYRKD